MPDLFVGLLEIIAPLVAILEPYSSYIFGSLILVGGVFAGSQAVQLYKSIKSRIALEKLAGDDTTDAPPPEDDRKER
jgi:hypothetical protein